MLRQTRSQQPRNSRGRELREVELIAVSPIAGEMAKRARRALHSSWCFNKLRYRAARDVFFRVVGVGGGRDELLSYFFFDPTYTDLQVEHAVEQVKSIQAWDR